MVLCMENISKAFSGRYVLRDIRFELTAGEVHVLAGENGAGKSTLVKILSGVHTEYGGRILLAGKHARFRHPHDAALNGISMIHQEMSLVPSMSVSDNIFLGRERTRAGSWLNQRAQRREARAILAQIGLAVDLARPVAEYAVAVQQMIEIAKSLAFDARVLVMDEPTSALSDPDVKRLFDIIGDLKRKGCAIVYISHRMAEIYGIGDRVTVLRDGQHVGTATIDNLPENQLVHWMVGRELNQQFPARNVSRGAERLSVESVSVPNRSGTRPWSVRDVSFAVKSGEILGIAGLQGSGNSELFRALFGAVPSRGRVLIDGKPASTGCPRHAIDQGLALLTNDRRRDGLILSMSIAHNITRAALKKFCICDWILPHRESLAANTHCRDLNIRLLSLCQELSELSGGNQQKVVLANWLETCPRVLLLDEPTRGIDVGAKHEIYELMNRWTGTGMSIVLITSEMQELLAMSDRVLVMHRGRSVAEFTRASATREKIVRAAMGDTSAECGSSFAQMATEDKLQNTE